MKKIRIKKVHFIPITKARINLGQVARRAHLNNEYFILEKDGIPIAGIMDADELEDYLEVHDPKVQAQIAKSTKNYLAGKSRPVEEFLAELERDRKKQSKPKRRRIA